jgi:hypothetical protein
MYTAVEQPLSSRLPLYLKSTFDELGFTRHVVYLGKFGGASKKPLQILHMAPAVPPPLLRWAKRLGAISHYCQKSKQSDLLVGEPIQFRTVSTVGLDTLSRQLVWVVGFASVWRFAEAHVPRDLAHGTLRFSISSQGLRLVLSFGAILSLSFHD